MAKKNEDTNSIRDEEVEVETRAAFAGKGDSGNADDGKMPNVTDDDSLGVAQRAVDSARSYNQSGGESSGTETEVY